MDRLMGTDIVHHPSRDRPPYVGLKRPDTPATPISSAIRAEAHLSPKADKVPGLPYRPSVPGGQSDAGVSGKNTPTAWDRTQPIPPTRED